MPSTRRTRSPRASGRHLRRAFGAERNELARPLDRARSRALLLAALAAGLAALLGAACAWADFASAQGRTAAAASHLHRTDAVLLAPAQATDADLGTVVRFKATATWTYPGDRHHTGAVPVSWKASSGASVRIWVGDSGRLSAAPSSMTRLVAHAMYVGLLVLGCLSVLTASCLGLRLVRLNRRARTAWQRSWAEVEPVWTGRGSPKQGNNDFRLA